MDRTIEDTQPKRTHQKKENLEDTLNLRLRQQESIAWLGEFAVRCQDREELFNEAVALVASTLNMEFCKLLELNPETNQLTVRAGVGWQEGTVGNPYIDDGVDSPARHTLRTDEPVIVDDLNQDKRFTGSPLLHSHQIVSGMSVVITGKEHPYGVMGVYSRAHRAFTEHDARFLKSIANILASAIVQFNIEDELRRSRDELAIILDGISEGITAQDRSGRLIYSNQAGADIIGFKTPAELISTPTAEVMKRFEVRDEDGNLLLADQLPGRQVFNGAPSASTRLRFRNLITGEERWSTVKAKPVLNPAGEVVLAVNIFRDVTDLVRRDQMQKLLAKAGSVLASSLDYEQTLANIAQMMVTDLADWCTIHLVNEKQEVYQLAVAHRDPSKVTAALDYNRRYPPDYKSDEGLGRVLKTGQPVYYPEVSDAMLVNSARDAAHLEEIRKLDIRSVMMVPLIARGRTLGAITLLWAESGRTYNSSEVELVEELARRAALAIDNAGLYQESQKLNAELEDRVQKRTRQLETSNRQLLVEVEERRRAESALRKSEAMLHSLFESAPDATILMDPAGTIIQVNRKAETVFGYTREGLSGKEVDVLISWNAWERAVRNGQTHLTLEGLNEAARKGTELKGRRKDGSEFPVEVTLNPVQTEDGELIICAVRDVTEARRMQTELAETHRRLFEGVEAERRMLSQELHDGPLQDLYGVALNLQSAQEVVGENVEDLETSKEMVHSIMQTLRGICGDLRPPTLVHMGLEKAIRSHLMKVQESHPNLTIHASLDNDGQSLSERTRLALYRVYQNSISNSLRHAQASEISVQFHVEEDRVILRIQDNGHGFVVPNRWVDLVRAGHFGLVGMSERVEAIGGHFAVISSPGEGATIEVIVPRNKN